MSTHNVCFRAKKEKKVYLCTPQFYYIKVDIRGYKSHGHGILMTTLLGRGSVMNRLLMHFPSTDLRTLYMYIDTYAAFSY